MVSKFMVLVIAEMRESWTPRVERSAKRVISPVEFPALSDLASAAELEYALDMI